MRASIEDAFEGDQINVVVDAEGPHSGDDAVSQDDVDGQGDEVATCKNGHSL